MMILMMFLSFQMQRFVFWCYSWCSFHSKCNVVFCCHSQRAELWTPCDLNSCLDMPEFVIRLRRTSDAKKMLPSSVMSHHSQCNLTFHGWTCSPWILIVDRRQEKSRQLSMFFWTHSKLVSHNILSLKCHATSIWFRDARKFDRVQRLMIRRFQTQS